MHHDNQTIPSWLAESERGPHLDLRPLLARGVDPLAEVLTQAAPVAPDGILVLIAPFNPAPLRRLLAARGFSSFGEKLGEGHWRIACRRDGEGTWFDGPSPEDCRGGPLGAPFWREDGAIHMDLRGLEAPLPMVTILRLLSSLDGSEPVVVTLDRNPVYLYPELAEIGWQWRNEDNMPGAVRLTLTRRPDAVSA